jgi:hypothetical protein
MNVVLTLVLCLVISPLSALAQSNGQRERAELQQRVAALVAAGDYAGLEQELSQSAAKGSRLSDGTWRLYWLTWQFGEALKQQHRAEKEWDAAAKRIQAVAKNRPQAWLLYAGFLNARGWAVRGPGFAREVAPEAWPVFRRYLSQAREVLDSRKAELASNPEWYAFRLTLATELSEGEDKTRAIYDEGVARHPRYHGIYFNRIRNVSPSWGGSKAQMLAVLKDVAGQAVSGPAAEEAIYARAIWSSEGSGDALIYDPSIDVEAFGRSLEVLAASYPDQWNLQKVFFMACERSLKAVAVKMLDKVKAPPLPALWGRNAPLFETCTDWATGKEPVFLMRIHDGEKPRDWVIK